MCGILTMHSMEKPIDEEGLKAGLAKLYHRGPDNTNYWISEDRRTALGHTRLSIMDLSHAGDQPISSKTGKRKIVANGEFYDFERIRGELQAKGYSFKTSSDTEIALHLYKEYGTHCLKYLRGEFAFAIWDSEHQTFFAARDRFGIKPLFYAIRDGILYLASEAKALFAAGIPAKWDLGSIATRAFYLGDQTMFAGIHQVPPGYYLMATPSGVRFYKYWDMDYPKAEDIDTSRSDEEYIEEIREEVRESVRLRMRSDAPLGIYLSGGVDSCTVLGFAAEMSPNPINVFTMVIPQEGYNEESAAQKTAERYNAKVYKLPITPENIAANFEDTVYYTENIMYNTHAVSKFLLSKLTRDSGVKTVLTGEGSDEIFAGYPFYRRDILLYNSEGQDQKTVDRLLEELKSSNQASLGLLLPARAAEILDFVTRTVGFDSGVLTPQVELCNHLAKVFSDGLLERYGSIDPLHLCINHLDVPNQIAGRDPVNISMYLWAKTGLQNYILVTMGDRPDMAHSIEGRTPLLDHVLAEKANKLPITMKIRGMRDKYVLREAAKHLLLPEVYRVEKHPFVNPPTVQDKTHPMYDLIQDTLRSSVVDDMPFYDKEKVVGFLDMIPKMPPEMHMGADAMTTEMLSQCVLQKKFNLSV